MGLNGPYQSTATNFKPKLRLLLKNKFTFNDYKKVLTYLAFWKKDLPFVNKTLVHMADQRGELLIGELIKHLKYIKLVIEPLWTL